MRRFTRLVTPANAEEVQRLDDEDDNFRDAMIGVQSGYATTLLALVARPAAPPPAGSAVRDKELCYVTVEFCTESGFTAEEFHGEAAKLT